MTKEELKTNPIEPELLNLLYVFLKDIGLNKEVEAVNKNKVKTKTRKVFHQLVTDNPYFPNNADVDLMLRAFFKDCIYGGVEIKGRNIKALVGAFRDFSIKPHLQNAFRVNRELPPKTERTIEEWTDQEIRKAVENVERLGLGWNDTNFYQRIKQQANLRGIL